MADALCGPSNALQSFKQHTQADKSIQQDRLAGPRTPVQGFRAHDPRAGSLDADFHAFENAAANPFQEPFVGNNFSQQPQFQQPAPPAWASDFQHLSISDQPLPAQHFRNYAPMIKSTNGGWHGEFMRQQQGERASIVQGKQAAFDQQSMSVYAQPMYNQAGFGPMSSFGAPKAIHQSQETSSMDMADQVVGADWSQAFEDAFQDAFTSADQVQQSSATEETTTVPHDSIPVADTPANTQQPEQTRIGSDAIDYTEMKDRTVDQEKQDASALARVAGELLHNVQHDSSEKFQNSQFLDLMRKIRDRQVEVRNNDFETTGAAASERPALLAQSVSPLSDQNIRNEPDPNQDQDTFAFPNMDAVYNPRQADFVDYTFDNDQYPIGPRNQISDLHPGGKLYPEQSSAGTYAQMSGAVSPNPISVADFEAGYDESRGLASRYQRTTA